MANLKNSGHLYISTSSNEYNQDVAYGLLCFVNYGNEKTFQSILDFYKCPKHYERIKNIRQRFFAFLTYKTNIAKYKNIEVSFDFISFFSSFIKSISKLKLWEKTDKELGVNIGIILNYVFSKENKQEDFLVFETNRILLKKITSPSMVSAKEKYKIFQLSTSRGDLYGVTPQNDKIKLTLEINKNNKQIKINTIKRLLSIKSGEEYIDLHKKIHQNIQILKEIGCPICNPSAIKRGTSPKVCANCNEIIEYLSNIQYLMKFGRNHINIEYYHFKKEINRVEFLHIRKRTYDRIKKMADKYNIKKCKSNIIIPLLKEYDAFLANNPQYSKTIFKNSNLKIILDAWS